MTSKKPLCRSCEEVSMFVDFMNRYATDANSITAYIIPHTETDTNIRVTLRKQGQIHESMTIWSPQIRTYERVFHFICSYGFTHVGSIFNENGILENLYTRPTTPNRTS